MGADKEVEVEQCEEEVVDQCKPVSKKHVKMVEEEVCKDVLLDVVETICDGNNINSKNGNDNNIDSYGPPKAPLYTEKPTEGNNSNGQGNRNHGGHDNGDDNNNGTDGDNSKCREVARKKVEKVCKVEAEEVCAKVPKNVCNKVTKVTPTKVCAPEEVKKCRWVIRNVSKQVDENVCTNVVRKECKEV